MEASFPSSRTAPRFRWFILIAFILAIIGWLMFTPPGLLGKADAVGYAVCHRLEERSFHIGERQVPLCARCTGMYIGAFIGLIYHLRQGRKGGMPKIKPAVVLGFFFVAWALDGVNSYLHFIPAAPHLYQPQNWLRLLTGFGLGLGMASVMAPVFNQSLWTDWSGDAALSTLRPLAGLIALCLLAFAATLTENPLILYPFAVLGSATVLALLTMIYTVVWTMLLRRENQFNSIQEAWWMVLAGLTTAILQIGFLDLLRFHLTGDWGGFPIG
jgi:uncharacterized membrane protein